MTEEEARLAYIALLPELERVHTRLLRRVRRAIPPRSGTVRSRIKTWESVRSKLVGHSSHRLEDLSDLVGIRIIVPTSDGLTSATERVARAFVIRSLEASTLLKDDSATHLVVRARTTVGRISTEIQILTAAEEARRALEHEFNYKPADTALAVSDASVSGTERLARILAAFELLLANPTVHEKHDIHPFLKTNTFILYPNPDAVASEVAIGMGTEYRIDFLVRRPDGTYLLIEIESPNQQILVQSGDFSAGVNHALCQVEDWQEWIEANLPTIDKYFPGIRAPEAWVVIGRDSASHRVRRRIIRRNINMRGRVTIKTYDDLLRDSYAYLQSISQAINALPPEGCPNHQ